MSARTFHGANGLAGALRERTQTLHTRAERTGIVNAVLRGTASRHGYVLLLRNLLPAYQWMEAGLERHRQAPGIGAFARPEIYRAKALVSDLRALAGVDWPGSLPLLPAGEQYAQRVASATEGDGTRLIGHAYARYLGDLSGGQILRRLLARTLGLGERELSFYDFPDVADVDTLKHSFRVALDRVGAEIADAEGIVSEAISAFELNIALSEAVQVAAGTL
jgi:heme oxygenase (biliverdin-producing, ferredoxin)